MYQTLLHSFYSNNIYKRNLWICPKMGHVILCSLLSKRAD